MSFVNRSFDACWAAWFPDWLSFPPRCDRMFARGIILNSSYDQITLSVLQFYHVLSTCQNWARFKTMLKGWSSPRLREHLFMLVWTIGMLWETSYVFNQRVSRMSFMNTVRLPFSWRFSIEWLLFSLFTSVCLTNRLLWLRLLMICCPLLDLLQWFDSYLFCELAIIIANWYFALIEETHHVRWDASLFWSLSDDVAKFFTRFENLISLHTIATCSCSALR